MNLNYNSITAKIYRWFYRTSNMPSSLCPYFWKMIIALLLAIPLWTLLLPALEFREEDEERVKIGTAILAYLAVFVAYCTFRLGHQFYSGTITLELLRMKPTIVIVIGFLSWIGIFSGTALVIGLVIVRLIVKCEAFLVTKLIALRKLKKPIEKKDKSITVFDLMREYAKAKYKNYCPQINWK